MASILMRRQALQMAKMRVIKLTTRRVTKIATLTTMTAEKILIMIRWRIRWRKRWRLGRLSAMSEEQSYIIAA
jgi:hypothetical protein